MIILIKKYGLMIMMLSYIWPQFQMTLWKKICKCYHEINAEYCLKVASQAKKSGIKKFIFASSCSMYGISHDNYPNEESELSPMTEYAKSKVYAEEKLNLLADENFKVFRYDLLQPVDQVQV